MKEEELKILADSLNLKGGYFGIYRTDGVTVPNNRKEELAAIKKMLTGQVPERDISFYAKELILFLHYQGNNYTDKGKTFEWYKESQSKNNITNILILILALFIILFITALSK